MNAAMMKMARLCSAALVACVTCVASGCADFHSKQAAIQVYTLQPSFSAAAAGATAATATLQVARPLAAPGLDTDGIALQRDGQRLDYYAASRWAAPLPEIVQSQAIEALRASGKFRSVQPEGAAFAADLVLQLEIRRGQAEYVGADGPPTVQVQLLATLGRRADRSVLATVSATGTAPASENRMQSVVAAFQAALGTALGELSAGLAAPGP
jgi:cholesterol transport system auxiliary component